MDRVSPESNPAKKSSKVTSVSFHVVIREVQSNRIMCENIIQ